MTRIPYFNTYDLISKSVATVSEVRTRNFSFPRNESGIRSSGGIVECRKDEAIEIDGFEYRSNEFLRTTTSPGGRPCGTRSALNFGRVEGS